jgi:tetratricopeptide (TPR) repeat protein
MSLEINQSNSPEYYLAQAQTANKKNDIISIIAMTSKCIALCEQNTEQMQEEKNTLTTAYILRANTLLKMGDTAGAEKDLNQLLAITNNKETEDILMLQGRILARKDNHKEAIEYFSKIIANNSSAIEALRERGASYLATGDRIKATEDAERIMTLSPDKVKAVSGDFKGEGTD